MGPKILFHGTFVADALRLINPGGWYIGVTSPVTNKIYAILPDLTGTGGITVGGDGIFAITNPETGSVENFTASDLTVFQAATARPQEPVARD